MVAKQKNESDIRTKQVDSLVARQRNETGNMLAAILSSVIGSVNSGVVNTGYYFCSMIMFAFSDNGF